MGIRRLAAAVAALLVLGAAPGLAATPSPSAAARVRCSGDPTKVHRLDLTIRGQRTWGLYALPKGRPKGLVAFGHGYGHTPESWRAHLARVAQRDGVIAFAMDYRGSVHRPVVRGWRVREGAEDTVHVARLFDWWIDVEGAANVIETYQEARALSASGNEFAVRATEDIEQEMGGPFESRADVYRAHTVVARVDDIATSGVRGVVIVHGVGDGLVPYDQSRELAAALRARGIPVRFFTVTTRGAGSEAGTTIDGYAPVPHESPFAGHASESSTTHTVGRLGFERLSALLRGDAPTTDGEVVR